MRTVEITRTGDAPVLDQLVEMRAWLREAGIRPLELAAVRVLNARVCYRASFTAAEDAERFRRRFDEEAVAKPL